MNTYIKQTTAALIGAFALATGSINAVKVTGAPTVKNKSHHQQLTAGKAHIIMFSADWCGACKANVKDIEEAIRNYPEIQFVVVDSDNPETFALKKEHNVQALPSYVFIDANGKKVAELHRGMITKSKLEENIAKLTGKSVAPSKAIAKTQAAPAKQKREIMHQAIITDEEPVMVRERATTKAKK